MTLFDRLSFVAGKRLGGGGKTERGYYDFVINEQPLTEILKPGDCIPPFGWLGSELERQYFLRLLLRVPSQLPSGRIPLYICPECADLGCGCMSVKVKKYDEARTDLEKFVAVAPDAMEWR